MSPLAVVSSLAAGVFIVHLVLRATLWGEFKTVRSRLPAIGAAALFLTIAAFPLGWLAMGLLQGQLECLPRSCHQVYYRDSNPVPYWFSAGCLFAMSAPLVSLVFRTIEVLFRTWRRTEPFAGGSESHLRARDEALKQQESEALDVRLRRAVAAGEIADSIESLARQRAEIATELRQREAMRRALRLPLISCGVLTLGIILILVFLGVFGPAMVGH